LAYVRRTFDGRPLTVLGYSRQRIPGNWKLMQENIKDPYHPGLLHVWFATFGLARADLKSQLIMDDQGRHACMISERNATTAGAPADAITNARQGLQLADDRILDIVPEPWWGDPTVCMTTIFPSVIFQQQVNSLGTRQIIPRGPNEFDFVWTHFGFADDDPEMTRRRLRQANMFGPAGYVSADDGEVIEFVQQGLRDDEAFEALNAFGGREIGDVNHFNSETLVRGMHAYWRRVMA
jgi:salicylate 5-hydroxylase large subunit